MYVQIILGLCLGIVFSLVAWWMGLLSKSGAIGAAVTGGLIFGLGGFPWATLLLLFFISSSLLSKTFSGKKSAFTEKFSKGSQRDWGQVLANGGNGALLVVLLVFLPEKIWIWCAYAGAIAAVNADTWATEWGVLCSYPPRLITTGKVVVPGTSGGISTLGLLATLGGASLIGIAAAGFNPQGWDWTLLLAVTLGGVLGSLFDSLLGATTQAIYYCPQCDKETEHYPQHSCGTGTTQVRGWRWMSNDWVNFLASAFGALNAVLLWLIF